MVEACLSDREDIQYPRWYESLRRNLDGRIAQLGDQS